MPPAAADGMLPAGIKDTAHAPGKFVNGVGLFQEPFGSVTQELLNFLLADIAAG